MSKEIEGLLDSFRSDLFYISKDRAIEDLSHKYRDKLMFEDDFFVSQTIYLREEAVKRILYAKGIVWQDDYEELENLYREKLYNHSDMIERTFKDQYGIDIKYEEDVGLFSLRYSDKKFLPKKFLNKDLQHFVKEFRLKWKI